MAYKGFVFSGSEVIATFRLDHTAGGQAHVFVAAASHGRTPATDAGVAAPAGFVAVRVTPKGPGHLEIAVDCAASGDSGSLSVEQGGATKNDEPITGDTSWVYTVVSP